MKRVLFLLCVVSNAYSMENRELFHVACDAARDNVIPITIVTSSAIMLYAGHKILQSQAVEEPIIIDNRPADEIITDFEEVPGNGSRFGTITTHQIRGLARTESLNQKSKGTFWQGVLAARLQEEHDHPERFRNVPFEG